MTGDIPETHFEQPTNGTAKRCLAGPEEHRPISRLADNVKDLAEHLHPPVPNPAPLGLIAFGLTTALLMIKHTRISGEEDADLEGVDTVGMGFALFFGGLVQLIAGLCEIRRNNIFGYTAFCLYGGFWMSIGTVQIVSLLSNGAATPANHKAIQAMFFLVALFSVMLWVLTFKMNKTICCLFFLLTTTLVLLCAGVDNKTVDQVGGYVGILTSANAFWLAFVELYNDVFGEGTDRIPLGHWTSNKFPLVGGAHSPGWINGHWPFLVKRRGKPARDEQNPDDNILPTPNEEYP